MAGDLLLQEWFWQARALLLVPLLQAVANIGLVMVVMMVVDRAYMFSVVVLVKLFGKKPHQRYKFAPLPHTPHDDVELATDLYPKVLVQIPMCNEREVYKLSICSTCRISWPSNKLIIQVLDDSTDTSIQELVQLECKEWANKGLNIKYELRQNRIGFKAGALKNALVQARWTFVNSKECLMTQMQEMTLRYHFLVEQEMGSSMHAFFGFNGTAGVWRISAIEEAGGWKDRTTVEDLDLSLRVSLKGWKFVYLNDLEVKSELPNTFEAFRHQQHRWSCGPASLFIKSLPEKIGLWRKVHIMYAFFVVRKFIVPMASFGFFCLVIPSIALFPEIQLPKWGVIYMPSLLTIINAMCNFRSIHFLFFSIFFETVMALHRTKATIIGLFGLAGANKWIVTKKLGVTVSDREKNFYNKTKTSFKERVYLHEMMVGTYILLCAIYKFKVGDYQFSFFLLIQASSFFVMGLGYIGIQVHT